MRIDALELIAFGHFEGHVIPFATAPGLHLIYGKNEAGKSTALRAIHAALYGVPTHEQQDRWKHGDHIRVGMQIDGPGGPLEFVRHRGRKNTLRDAADKPYADDILAPYLGTVDEATFRILFGLNHNRLVEEGRALMEGGGELGKTLFAAGSGIGHFRETIAALSEEAQRIFAERAHKPALNAALKRYTEARAAVKDNSISANRWKELVKERDQAEARVAELAEARAQNEVRRMRLGRLIDALPLVASHRAVLDELTPLGDGPVVDGETIGHYERSFRDQRNAQRECEEAAEKRKEWIAALADLEGDDAILAHADALNELQEGRDHYVKAKQDLDTELRPKLAARKQDAQQALERIAPHTTDGGQAVVDAAAAQRRKLTELLAQPEALQEDLEEARREVARIEARLTERDGVLENTETAPDPAPVLRALDAARDNSSLEREHKQLLAQLTTRRIALDETLKRLAREADSWSALLERAIPGKSRIDEHLDALEKLRNDMRLAESQRETAARDRDDARKTLDALVARHDLASVEELETARAERDARVDATFTAIAEEDLPTAAAESPRLRQAVTRADALADRMLTESREAEQLAQAQRALAQQEGALARAEERLEVLAQDQAQLETAWQELWTAWPAPPVEGRDIADWLREYDKFQQEVREYRENETRAAVIVQQLDEDNAAIRALLDEAQRPHKLDADQAHSAHLEALNQAADHLVAAAAEYNEWVRDRDRIRQEELPKARANVERKSDALTQWQDAWQRMGDSLALKPDTAPEALRPVLDELEELPRIRTDIASLEERMAQVESALAGYEKKCAELCAALDYAAAAEAPETIVRSLVTRRKAAEALALKRTAAEDRIADAADREEKARTRAAEAEAKLESLRVRLSAATQEDLPKTIEMAQKRQELRQKWENIEENLRFLAAGQTLEEFVAELEAADRDVLEHAHIEAVQMAETLRSEEQQATDLRAQARLALESIDTRGKAAEAALEAESVAAEIERHLSRYLRIKAAETALAAAIERYQEANEQPILQRASQYFQQLTLDQFARLRPDYHDDGSQTLLAERPEGARLGMDGLSEGTADQLYLALRLAGLEQHFSTHAPMPFIADDLFVNFDDDRAVAGLQALADFSHQTQVVFFTHHAHLIELARAQLPSDAFTVHELP